MRDGEVLGFRSFAAAEGRAGRAPDGAGQTSLIDPGAEVCTERLTAKKRTVPRLWS